MVIIHSGHSVRGGGGGEGGNWIRNRLEEKLPAGERMRVEG
jgi:hypothetical protein